MRFSPIALALVALPLMSVAVQADERCNDLWFTRNAIINQAGYCFGSNLGKALFDNSDCQGKSVTLSPEAQQQVAQIQEMEKQGQCRVNSAGTTLDLQDLAQRRQLWHFPIWDDYESACLGWLSAPAALRAGHSPEAPVIGQIQVGDTVRYGHMVWGDWSYAMIFDGSWTFKTSGWLNFNEADEACEEFAG